MEEDGEGGSGRRKGRGWCGDVGGKGEMGTGQTPYLVVMVLHVSLTKSGFCSHRISFFRWT